MVAFERSGEVEGVVVAAAVRDLADGEVGESQEAGGFEHHAVEDEFFGGLAGDGVQSVGEGGGAHGECVGVVGGVMVAHVVAFELADEADVEARVAGVCFAGGGVFVPAVDPEQQGAEEVALQVGGAFVRGSSRLIIEGAKDGFELRDAGGRDGDGRRGRGVDQPGGCGLCRGSPGCGFGE